MAVLRFGKHVWKLQ